MYKSLSNLNKNFKKTAKNTAAAIKGRITRKPYETEGREMTILLKNDGPTTVQERVSHTPVTMFGKKMWVAGPFCALKPKGRKERKVYVPFEAFSSQFR